MTEKQLLHPHQLHDYQRECVMHMLNCPDSMLWLQMGLGKEQPNSEPVRTRDGWVPIGDLVPGDEVIGSDGLPTRVMSVHPQGEKEVLKVTFNDGTWTRCGWDHLWNVRTDNDKFIGKSFRTMSIRDIVDAGLKVRNGKNGSMLKWSIPMVHEVAGQFKHFAIDPYLYGVLLGDGTFSGSSAEVCTDVEIIERCGLTPYKSHETSEYTAYARVIGGKTALRKMGMESHRSWEKFVHSDYMYAAPYQRLGVLQGLMDTDGTPIGGGGAEFSTTSEQLALDVVELTQSLGGVARMKGPRVTKHRGGDGRPSWRVNVKLPRHLTPFLLERKLAKWQRPTKYLPNRKIQSVEVVGREQSRCIAVSAPDHLYVTRNHIVTHNTPITLTVIVERMRALQVKKTLVFGPLRVIQAVWNREARKWSHTQHLRFSVIHGDRQKKQRALFADADVYVCNYENMNWLAQQLDHYYVSQGKPLPFQMVVYDEVSKLKNSTTKRMAGGTRDIEDALGPRKIKITGWRKMIDQFQYRTGLTGTPASNGYLDLHGQYLAVDGGERLGPFITHYKDSYFASDYNGWNYTPTEQGKQLIEQKISDITKKMDAADYLDLPECKVTNLMVDLPPKVRKLYDDMEKQMFMALESGAEVEVFSRASVSNKCLQICNGTPYLSPESPEWEKIHDVKLDALEDVLEEAGGAPVLCSYSFKSDAARIMQKFKKYKPVNLTDTPSSQTEAIINKWNRGEIKLLIGHPASMGHGVDGLQDSGSVLVWFGLNWSLELYEQMNGRLNRQGQTSSVSIIRILCRDTVDLAVADAIERKTDDQEGLKAALQRYRDGHTDNDLSINFY